jgi:hypothetical protein
MKRAAQRARAAAAVRVVQEHGRVSAGAAQVRRKRAHGGVQELVERDVAAREGAARRVARRLGWRGSSRRVAPSKWRGRGSVGGWRQRLRRCTDEWAQARLGSAWGCVERGQLERGAGPRVEVSGGRSRHARGWNGAPAAGCASAGMGWSRPRGSEAGTGAGGAGAELEQRELGSAAPGGMSVDAAPGGMEQGVGWPCRRM